MLGRLWVWFRATKRKMYPEVKIVPNFGGQDNNIRNVPLFWFKRRLGQIRT